MDISKALLNLRDVQKSHIKEYEELCDELKELLNNKQVKDLSHEDKIKVLTLSTKSLTSWYTIKAIEDQLKQLQLNGYKDYKDMIISEKEYEAIVHAIYRSVK